MPNGQVSNTDQRIVIGIPTFRRPVGLSRLLESVGELRVTTPIDILVAENDAESKLGLAAANTIVEESFPFRIEVVVVPERGISQARNALLREAFTNMNADFLAMVDDDEAVHPEWLEELIATQRETQADIVGGKVIPEFSGGVPEWAKGLEVYFRPDLPDGPVQLIQSTASVLISSRVFLELGLRFDTRFSLTGGGDKEFFVRLKNLGAKFAFTNKAISYESYDADRSSRRWALKRAFRVGAGDMRILLRHRKNAWHLMREFMKIPVAIGFSTVGMLVFVLFNQRRFMKAALLMSRQLGKLSGLTAFRVKPYRVTHGA